MHVETAQRAGSRHNADRVFVTDNTVIVLDGASAMGAGNVDPGTYAATLGAAIANALRTDPRQDLVQVVADGISRTRDCLGLSRDRCPSSTVSILRATSDAVDLYVLGDSPIHYGTDTTHERLTDDRLRNVARHERARYVDRLRAGHGYDDEHRAILSALQQAQRHHRNQIDGYWIAESDPHAASNAITMTVPRNRISWAVLATDGASNVIDYNGHKWPAIAHTDARNLVQLLDSLHEWEATTDPDGQRLPRAKRHDDKTLAAVASVW